MSLFLCLAWYLYVLKNHSSSNLRGVFMKFFKTRKKIEQFKIETPKGNIQYVDIDKTKDYYKTKADMDLCQCETCKIYYKEVKERMPDLDIYLCEMGVDITKPFEAPAYGLKVDHDYEEYFAWYIVFGKCDADYARKIGEHTIFATGGHPKTGVEEDHFVLQVDDIIFK